MALSTDPTKIQNGSRACVFVTDGFGDEALGVASGQQASSVATRHWKALLDWAAAHVERLDRPALYTGPHGLAALSEAYGADLGVSWRLSLTPAKAFEPTPGLLTAALLDWPDDVLEGGTTPLEVATLFEQADLLVAPDERLVEPFRKRDAQRSLIAPTPLGPRSHFDETMRAPVLTNAETQNTVTHSAALWSWEAGALKPRLMADALKRRRGPLFLTRLDVAADEAASARLMKAAVDIAQATPGRLIVALDLGDHSVDDLVAEPFLSQAVGRVGEGIGFVTDPLSQGDWRGLASIADATFSLSTGVSGKMSDERVWLALAASTGRPIIALECAQFEDLIANGAASSPSVRFRLRRGSADCFVRAVDAKEMARRLTRIAQDEKRTRELVRYLSETASFEAVWAQLSKALEGARQA